MAKQESLKLNIDEVILKFYSSNKDERAEAVSNLVLIGKPAVAQLIPLLSDFDWRVRYRTLEALGQIGDEKVLPLIVKCLCDEKDHVRYMAAKSIGISGISEVSSALIPLIIDENEYVRRMAKDSMEKIKEK